MVTKRQWLKIKDAKKLFDLGDRATLSEIKTVFRHLTKKYHPDLAGESEENRAKTQEVTEAYQALLTYCESYEFPLVMSETDLEVDDEDWWMNRFGQDHHWGPGKGEK